MAFQCGMERHKNNVDDVLETQQISEPEEKPLSYTQIYTIS